jgi:hypothetical protein
MREEATRRSASLSTGPPAQTKWTIGVAASAACLQIGASSEATPKVWTSFGLSPL